MKTIYSIQLPFSILPGVATTRTLPPGSLYQVPQADVQHMQWSEGDIIRQRFIAYDFMLELFEINLGQDVEIEIEFRKPSVLFYYGLMGNIVCKDKQSGRFSTLAAGQYGAVNAASGIYQITLSRGYSCGLLFIFDTDYLSNFLKMAPSDFRMGAHFRIGSPFCHTFPFFTLSSIDQLYQQLTAAYSERRSMSLKIALLSLLKAYGAQLARFNSKPFTEAFEKLMSVKHYLDDQVIKGPLPHASEIAREFHIHPDTLSRAFKDNFGIGLKRYINQIKMRHAFLLLTQDRLSILIVSEMLGYNSTSSFSTQFRSYYGFPPGKAAGIIEM
jgi:AraC-like DNA-binding protein